jgi:hypothetical protein
VANFFTPDLAAKAYTTFLSYVADNTVSAIRLSNNVIFSALDAWKPALQQAKAISRFILNTGVNAARTFEQNSRQIAAADVKDVAANSNTNTSANTPNSTTTSNSRHH